MNENLNLHSFMDCAIDISKTSKETLVIFPLSRLIRKDQLKMVGRAFECFVQFNDMDKVTRVDFFTIGGSHIKVMNLDTDDPIVEDCSVKPGVE